MSEESEEILSPWDAMAKWYCDATGVDLADARDIVIGWGLGHGDTRPFYGWVLDGHTPSHEVMRVIAAMMAKADSPGMLPQVEGSTRYGLKVTGRKRGDRSNPETDVRNYFIGLNVAKLIEAGEKYEAAVARVHAWLPGTGVNVSHQTVRDAYDELGNLIEHDKQNKTPR